MKSIIFLFFVLLVSCSCQPNKDPTPQWDQNNRYGLEMISNCNLENHTVGMNGCAFVGAIPDNATLTLPPIWSGSLKFESTQCGEYNFVTTLGNSNIIPLKEIYANTTGENCSFTITRIVRVGKYNLDNTITGRFFIKMIPDNRYYNPLKISISKNVFNGVAWFQKKYGQAESAVTFYPKGTHGTFSMYCGTNLIKQQDYNTSPFTVTFDNLSDCDYEVSTVNMDNPAIEFGTYVHETSGYTENITPPSVKITPTLHYIKFEFTDPDVTGKRHAVVGMVVNGRRFSTYKAMVKGNMPSYEVKGITMNGRYFLGTYTLATKTWDIK